MRRRTRAREAAVQFLYQIDLREGETAGGIAAVTSASWKADLEAFLADALRDGLLPDEDSRDFARRLVAHHTTPTTPFVAHQTIPTTPLVAHHIIPTTPFVAHHTIPTTGFVTHLTALHQTSHAALSH